MIAIINASPLIYLGKIGAINLLPELFEKCITTDAVKTEVLSKRNAPEHLVLERIFADWLEINNPKNKKFVERLEILQVHLGEASVIALAQEMKETRNKEILILDDLLAREIAKSMGLKCTGTIGIILRAFNSEIIIKQDCKKFISNLVEGTSFRISVSLYSKILKEIERKS